MMLKDGIRSHPKLLKVTPEACWLWVTAIDYSRAHLLDGFVPTESLDVLGRFKAPQRLAETLASAGLFEKVDGGYTIHDFLAHNDSADDVREKRARDLARKRQRNPEGFHADSTRIPNGKKDARAIARERVGVGVVSGSGSDVGTTPPKEQEPQPRETPDGPLVADIWDAWREACEAVGIAEFASMAVKHYPAAKELLGMATVGEWRRAFDVFLDSPEFAGKRSWGMCLANAPQLLGHVRMNPGQRFGVKPEPTMGVRGSRTTGNAAAAANVIARIRQQAAQEAS